MKTLKRIIAVCFCILLSFSCVSVAAGNERVFKLTMDTAYAAPGNTVTLALNVEDNPGIAAMSFTVHYDTSVLEFVDYVDGIIPKDTINSQLGYVRVVYVARKDNTGDGALCGFKFKVKRSAKAGLSAVTLKHIDYKKKGDSLANCFANLSLDTLTPQFTAGGVDVGYTLTNHTHEFSDWQTVIAPDCEKDGVMSRKCINCKYSEEKAAEKSGHKYSEKWTVDEVATEENDGTASRRCLNTPCEERVDEKSFSLALAKQNGFKNEVGETLTAEDFKSSASQSNSGADASTETGTSSKQPEKNEDSTNSLPKDENVTSQELIEEVIKQEEEKEAQKTFFDKLSQYLFGEQNKGLLELIFGKSIDAAGDLWSLVLKIILAIF